MIAMPPSSTSTNLHSFSNFAALPIEIRLRIWQFAAHRRPRVIQVGYDTEGSCWKAWKDGLGGLPSIVHVSREARGEALKSYSRIFDACIDPEEDTVFISDPLFAIRNPRNIFMSSESASRLRKVAFTSEIYNGLAQSCEQFPSLCERPATVLRRLKGLTHFTLALSDDGAGFDYDDDDEAYEVEDEDEEGGYEEDAQDRSNRDGSENESNGERELRYDGETEDTLDEGAVVRQFLDRLDEEAIETMSKEYFRHVGNIHFESAAGHPDHWEAWIAFRDELEESCEQEKKQFPDWTRPKVSVMAVEYGLRRLEDFKTSLHLLGDHSDDVLEQTADGFESDPDEESDRDFLL